MNKVLTLLKLFFLLVARKYLCIIYCNILINILKLHHIFKTFYVHFEIFETKVYYFGLIIF